MGKFLDLLCLARAQKRPIVLVASLPKNDPDLARGALDGGADVLKVHINVHHHASGTHFGSLEEEQPCLEQILKIWQGRPVGIVPAGNAQFEPETLATLSKMGFDFISLYSQDAPVGLLPPTDQLSRMLALSFQDTPEVMAGLPRLPVQIAELSIMHPDTYGQPFTYHDLALLASAVQKVAPLPAVLPSQHHIQPQCVAEIQAVGIAGLMIGVIAAGDTPKSWLLACRSFRAEIEACFEPDGSSGSLTTR